MKTLYVLSLFCVLSPLLASMYHDTASNIASESPAEIRLRTRDLVATPVCETFDRLPFFSGAMSQTKGLITVILQTQYQAGKDWIISSTALISSITITSNGTPQDRTGQTLLNGDFGADIITAVICTSSVHDVRGGWYD